MKTIFKIHPITYLIILSLFMCGYYNYFLMISVILIFHDLGHLIMMKMFKVKINKIIMLPFGSIIYSNLNYNFSSKKNFLIAISGILFQIILDFIFYYLFNFGLINQISYHIFLRFNKLIILFNLLPIIPLDGSKMFGSILEELFPYRLSIKIKSVISGIFILILIFNSSLNFNLVLISFFLIYKTYDEIFNLNFIYYKFLLERYLNNYLYSKTKYVNSINNLYKNRFNFINNISERKYLNNLYNCRF